MESKICPKCGKSYTEQSALSRADNNTLICPDCGVREALMSISVNETEQEEILAIIHRTQSFEDRFLEAVNSYLVEEFGIESKLDEIPKCGIIHLASTTYEFNDDTEHDIQVDFDLNTLSYLNYIDGEKVLEESRNSPEEFMEEISGCSFEDVIRDCVHEGFNRF